MRKLSLHSTTYERVPVAFDIALIVLTTISLLVSFLLPVATADFLLAFLSFIGVVPVFASALRGLWNRKLSIDLLASVALFFSLMAHEWFSAAFITLMLAFARLFDQWTATRTKKIITHLLKFRPVKVKILHGETVTEKSIGDVRVGDHVLVETGERVPVDGVVIKGEAALNQASLTGESELVQKKVGDEVFTATLNESGSLVVEAKKVGADTTLAKIISLVEEASRKKSKTERVAESFTQWYILATFVGSGILFMSGLPVKTILSILLVVCADDIAVAVPLGFTSAIARAARDGVIVKGSDALEKLSRMRYFFTDKTGTLTYGRPQIACVHGFGNYTADAVLGRLAVGSAASGHPISRAITAEAKRKNLPIGHTPDDFSETPGLGMTYTHEGEKMLSGRLEFLEKQGVVVSEAEKKAVAAERDKGRTVTLLSVNGTLAGFVSAHDELKPTTKEAINETKALGVREWHMLTGDNPRVAKAVASELGIHHYHSELSPEDKVHLIEKFKKETPGIIGMAGDGVNDAASLALVDVSVAMGGVGTDAAIEAADITIMHDDLRKIPHTMRLAQSMMRVVHEDFVIWAVTNASGLILVFAGVLGPAGAATFNFLTDFLPIGNSLKILRKK